jgi:trehalose synthase
MLETVDVGERSIEAYRGVAPDGILEELRRVAEGLRSARVLQLNATPYGGGVSELLHSAVPCSTTLAWSATGGSSARTTPSSR